MPPTPVDQTPATTPTLSPALNATVAQTAAPAAASLEQRINRLAEQLEQRRKDLHIPGMAIAVVQDDEVILVRGFGLADLENETPVTPETIFAIGSITKSFTATLVGMLVDEGEMGWDDPVTEHIPYFTLNVDSDDENAEVTIRDMLSHRTGFTQMGLLFASGLFASGMVPREEVLLAATRAEPWVGLREKYYYNNVMYTAAGVAAGNAAGTDWDALVAERIFEPLGMSSSNTSVSELQSDPHLSLGYRWDKDLKVHKHQPMWDVDHIGPAGAINSNVLDMAQWLRFQLGHGAYNGDRLLSETQHKETWTSQIEMGGGNHYGLGWGLREWRGQPIIQHGGRADGFRSQMALWPESNLGFVLLTNMRGTPLQEESINMVWDALLGELEAEEGDIEYRPYLGKYVANFGSFKDAEFTVLIQNNHLAIDVPGQTVYELKDPDEVGKWYFAFSEEIAVSFERNDAGDVTMLKQHQSGLTVELPRVGAEVPVEIPLVEIPLDELQKYLGSYCSEDVDVKVVIQNNRLAIDVPGQSVFELYPPDEEGKWVFRAIDGIAVAFNESDAGVESMTRYEAGQGFNMPRIDVASEPLPAVDDILALRDTDSWKVAREEIGTYLMTGTVWVPQSGVEGALSEYVSGIDRIRVDADYGKFGSTRSAVNGDRAWIEEFGRFAELHGKRLEQALQEHPAATDDWRDYFDSIRVLSTGELDGRKVYVLKLQRGKLPPATFYVDADTGDLLKSETIERAQGGVRIPVVSFYEDYREVHGMRIPFRVVARIESSDPSRTVIQYDTIEINVEVNDDIFTLSPPTEAFEGKALGGAPPPNLIFEGVGYTFGGYQTVDPGESTIFVIDGIDINVTNLKLVGTTTEGNTHGIDQGLQVYRSNMGGGANAVYTFTLGETHVNPEDGQIFEFAAGWTQWTASND